MAQSFTLFPRLPPEIQLHIWAAALETAGPRTIQLQPWTCECWRRWNKGCASPSHQHDDASDCASHRAMFVLWGYLETPFDGSTCGVHPAYSVPTSDALAATCLDARRAVLKRFPRTMDVYVASTRSPQGFVKRMLRFDPATDIVVCQDWRGFSKAAPAFDPRAAARQQQHQEQQQQNSCDGPGPEFADSMKLVQNVAIRAKRCDCNRGVRTSRFWRHMCGIEQQMGRLHFMDSLRRVCVFVGDGWKTPEGLGGELSRGSDDKEGGIRELTAKQEALWAASMRKKARARRRSGHGRQSDDDDEDASIGDAVVMAGVVRRRFGESDLAWLRANGWASRMRAEPEVVVWARGTTGEADLWPEGVDDRDDALDLEGDWESAGDSEAEEGAGDD